MSSSPAKFRLQPLYNPIFNLNYVTVCKLNLADNTKRNPIDTDIKVSNWVIN